MEQEIKTKPDNIEEFLEMCTHLEKASDLLELAKRMYKPKNVWCVYDTTDGLEEYARYRSKSIHNKQLRELMYKQAFSPLKTIIYLDNGRHLVAYCDKIIDITKGINSLFRFNIPMQEKIKEYIKENNLVQLSVIVSIFLWKYTGGVEYKTV